MKLHEVATTSFRSLIPPIHSHWQPVWRGRETGPTETLLSSCDKLAVDVKNQAWFASQFLPPSCTFCPFVIHLYCITPAPPPLTRIVFPVRVLNASSKSWGMTTCRPGEMFTFWLADQKSKKSFHKHFKNYSKHTCKCGRGNNKIAPKKIRSSAISWQEPTVYAAKRMWIQISASCVQVLTDD